MSTDKERREIKLKHKKKEDIIILETIKEIKDRKKIKANSGRKLISFLFFIQLFKVSDGRLTKPKER